GTACIIGAYGYLTFTKAPNPFLLHGTNLAGAGFLTISLLVHTNWASLVLEGFWASIAIIGLIKAALGWRRSRGKPSESGS
ncbi:MAG: permease, partial [Pseudomonadota bacterium]